MENELSDHLQKCADPEMHLRDYFAAQALAGLLSCRAFRLDCDIPTRAKHAYKMADAMMEARKSNI